MKIVGDHLPKIKIINISVVACDANVLAQDKQICRLEHLEALSFFTSLLNRRRSGFDVRRAARFISALISSETVFEVNGLTVEDFGPDEDRLVFAKDYNEFADEFKKLVVDYVEVRKGEASR